MSFVKTWALFIVEMRYQIKRVQRWLLLLCSLDLSKCKKEILRLLAILLFTIIDICHVLFVTSTMSSTYFWFPSWTHAWRVRLRLHPPPACHCQAGRATLYDDRAQWIAAASLCAIQRQYCQATHKEIQYMLCSQGPSASSIYCMLKSRGHRTQEGGIVGPNRSLHNDKVAEQS